MTKFKLTQKHINLGNDMWEGNLTDSELVKKYGISPRTVTRWKKRPEIEDILRQRAEDTRRTTQRLTLRYADRAVKSLVKLTETVTIKTEEGEDQRFKYKPEVVRKAACDILDMAGLKTKDGKKDSTGNSEIPEKLIIEWGGDEKKDQIDDKAYPG